MSTREYEKFMRAIRKDSQLSQKLNERIAEAADTNAVETTVAFAQRHGYKVDAMDVHRARN